MIDETTQFVSFDTETTGLSAADGRVVEIAAIRFDITGNEIARFAELVNPTIPIPEGARRVHKITDDMVADRPTIDEVLPRFIEFIGDPETVLLAQNAIFDIGFVNHEALRHEMRLPRNGVLDQIDITRAIFPGLPSYGLENLCRRFNLVDAQEHRAMADAVLVKRLFFHCLRQRAALPEWLGLLNAMPRYSFGGPMIVSIDEALVERIRAALEHGQTIEIVYAGGSMQGRLRPVKPIVMYNRDGVAYLTARCLLSDTNKQFRIDRIELCRPVER